ncbi:23S rRNA (adenine(2503)-C(2))-methyltransferase RlmN [Chondromyces apiculatus]|uniref:Probable dual-specificity RNA methyltransferase RlmN n=1 Tax=Chondromyces apiculatus DSM 436 TaxID=1192034 RepID=A0A017T2D3_9BACT|nr:23S rRNA (adenine(2503)-C(2))-methyltransferase RlmN [Chondromyces apiculatus]EYF03424.1 Ribosomal RNA large subunit methyltransferase N [Chondromyces apiculatus DSM 436]
MTSAVSPVARLPEEWETSLRARGERAFTAKQVFHWIHRRGVLEPASMTNLSGRLREALATEGLGTVATVERIHRAADGTRKLLVRLRDGATIETVLLPAVTGPGARGPLADADADEDDEDDDERGDDAAAETAGKIRVTQCISTQVGCAMGCVFCASGIAGLKRHLGADEIVAQVLLGRALLDEGEALRNVVYMGMGEPLHNYEATARSLRLLTHREGISLSSRRVTVSTSGLIPEIARLGADFGGQIGLAISLHAADDEARGALMPINRKYPLPRLLEALHAYPLPRRRRITIEYTLVSGKNDDPDEARKLVKLLRGLPVKVNLIPMNPIEASPLGPPDWARVEAFQRVLIDAGYSCFIRRQRGDDVSAACGQLVLLGAKPKVKGFRAAPSS